MGGGTGQGDAHGSFSANCFLSPPLSPCYMDLHGLAWIYRALGWSWDSHGVTVIPLTWEWVFAFPLLFPIYS